MSDHYDIYRTQARMYDEMIRLEDPQGNIGRILREWMPQQPEGRAMQAADIGAGTGRLAVQLAPHAASVVLTDTSSAMLEAAADRLRAAGHANWETHVADSRALPLADRSVDLVTAGWTICYLASSNVPEWRANLAAVMIEIRRILRPGGTVILFETMGTGFYDEPSPPSFLLPYYEALEREYGFERTIIDTPFVFESAEEAVRIARFFFGDALADEAAARGAHIIPSYTAAWRLTKESMTEG